MWRHQTCAGIGHHLRPDSIVPGAPYFGKSLPVRPLWLVVCFGKLSLSDIPITNNQAASDRVSAVAKVPSKWRGRRKRNEFRPCWRVKCGMSLHPAGNIRVATIRRATDTFLFISHTTNVLLFKCRCNIFIAVRIIKEMPGSVGSGTPCIINR